MRILSPLMPGLTVKQAAIYFVVREMCETADAPVRRLDIAKTIKLKPDDGTLSSVLDVLMIRHFITKVEHGLYQANEPPHHVVTREVCADFKITRTELYGPGKSMPLCRARRMFSRRLRKAGYLMCDIARILNRDKSTVADYFYPEVRLQRLVARTARRRRAKADNKPCGHVDLSLREYANHDHGPHP